MQKIRMTQDRRGWFSDNEFWAQGQVLEVQEDVADYLVNEVAAAEYVDPEPEYPEPDGGTAVSVTDAVSPAGESPATDESVHAVIADGQVLAAESVQPKGKRRR